jgi:AcrR family transcriptional regulator
MARKTTVPRKRRPGRIARQTDLLTIVYKVVSEVGIDAPSMRQIADRAKVNTGTISYYFENKEKLVMAALPGGLSDAGTRRC